MNVMNIHPIYSNSYNYRQSYNTNFKRTQVSQKTCVNNVAKKFMPLAFITFFLGLIGTSCNSDISKRQNEKYDYDGITIELTEVQPETKDSVLMPVFDLKSKLTEKNDFLNNLKIDIIRSFRGIDGEKDSFKGYLRENHSASHIKGMSFYSDNKLKKRIAIQERAHKNNENVSKVQAMQQSLMHEIGHQFDNYFGHDHNSQIALQWDSLQHSKAFSKDETPYDFYSHTKNEQRIDNEFNANNELSDREEFKKAFFKDLINIKEILEKSPENLPKNINYYIAGIDFSAPIDMNIIEDVDLRTDEVYANTFSYLMETDEGDKIKFLNTFSNCAKIVESDIAKYLNIKK